LLLKLIEPVFTGKKRILYVHRQEIIMKITKNNPTIGIDIGDLNSHLRFINDEKDIYAAKRIPTTIDAYRRTFGDIDPAVVTVETGQHSSWIIKLLKECGHEVIVINTRKARQIYMNPRKCDKKDAEILARLARDDEITSLSVENRSQQRQLDLSVIQARDKLIGSRTSHITYIRYKVKQFGGRIPSCAAKRFHDIAVPHIQMDLLPLVSPLLEQIRSFTDKVDYYDCEIDRLCHERYQCVLQLLDIPGVNKITALAFVIIIGDPNRFTDDRTVGAYLGLTPTMNNSGNRERYGGITRNGNKLLRSLLVQCGQNILLKNSQDTDLKNWGMRTMRRGIPRNKVTTGVARKLAIVLNHLWRTGEEYKPLHNMI
jgi:transposase